MYRLLEIFILVILPISYYIKNIEILYVLLISYFTFIVIFKEKIQISSILKYKTIKYLSIFMLITIFSSMHLILTDQGVFLQYITQYIRMWTYFILVIYVYIMNNITKYDFTNNIIKTIIYSSVVPNIIGLIQLKIDIFTTVISEQGTYRIGSTFAHPNFYGYFLVIVISCLLYMYNIDINKKNKICILLYIIVNIFLLYKTESRTTLFLGIFIIAINILKYTKNYEYSIRTPILILFIFILMSISIYIILRTDFLESRFNVFEESGSFNWRVMKWINALTYWIQNPTAILTGLGWMTSFVYTADEMYLNFSMHNEYVRILFETGVIGFIVYIKFVRSIYKNIKLIDKQEYRNLFYYAYIIFIIGSLTGNLLGVPENTMYFFIIFACTIKNNYKVIEEIKYESITCN